MLLADYEGLLRIPAKPGLTAACPMCHASAVAKCGKIVAWHWAHESVEDCDPWAEPETHWHIEWQGMWPPGSREVVMRSGDQRHRADVVAPDGTVVELQHSSISPDDIVAREQFYGSMIWIFDAIEAAADQRLLIRNRGGDDRYRTFRWKHPRKTVASCRKPVFLDLGEGGILRVRKAHFDRAPHGGWGYMTSRNELLELLGRQP